MKGIIASILLPFSGLLINPENVLGGKNSLQNFQVSNFEQLFFQQEDTKINYHKDRKTIASKGNELKGEKVGVWEFFNEEGELYLRFNFTTREVLFQKEPPKFNNSSTFKFKVVNDNLDLNIPPDRLPISIANLKGSFKSEHVIYPQNAKRNQIEGIVNISFIIDEKGNSVDFKVEEGIGGGCDEEALRVVSTVFNNMIWTPAILNNEPVKVKCIFPIRFSIK